MAELQTRKFKSTRTQEAVLEYAEMNDSLYLVKCTLTETMCNIAGEIVYQDITAKEGFMSPRELKSLMREDAIDLEDTPSVRNYIVLKEEHREHLKLNGWIGVFAKELPPQVEAGRLMDALSEGEWAPSDLYRKYTGDEFRDLDGQVIPVALFGSGLFGGFSDKNYDLPKALEVLKARSDVRIVREESTGYQEIVHDPYSDFNHICFYYTPSAELAGDIAGLSEMESWKVIVERDLLGLEAAGASLAQKASEGTGPKGP